MDNKPKPYVMGESLFKGNPVLKIWMGTRRDGEDDIFSFGVKKAQVICDHIDEIRRFADRYSI